MLINTVFSGFGGQGVLMMGYVLAVAAMRMGRNVTYLPSYGAEVRGGTANCTIAIGDEEIASPVASSPEFIVVMNEPSLRRFENAVQSGGGLFINSSMVNNYRPLRGDIETYEVPANELVRELGHERLANMVMLGAYREKTKIVTLEAIDSAVEEIFAGKGKAVVIQNQKALRLGHDCLR